MHLIAANIPSNKHFKVIFATQFINYSEYISLCIFHWTFDNEFLDKSAQKDIFLSVNVFFVFYRSLITKITQPKRYVT